LFKFPVPALTPLVARSLFRCRQFRKQRFLSAELFSPADVPEMVVTVAVHFPCVIVVLEVYVQAFRKYPFLQLWLKDRKTYLNAAKEVSIHPVRAGQVYGVCAITPEVENPTVFKKTPND
jgi:hypothetical protein